MNIQGKQADVQAQNNEIHESIVLYPFTIFLLMARWTLRIAVHISLVLGKQKVRNLISNML